METTMETTRLEGNENSRTVLQQAHQEATEGRRLIPWIAVSGLDGSGKTTLVDNLEKYFTGTCGMRVKRDRLPHDPYLVKELLNVSDDKYTDRLLFALDNRIFAARYRKWSHHEFDVLLTQRCNLDSFVHGAVQGFSYAEIGRLNGIADLPRCDVIIHLVAEAATAYKRICDDPDADKFEYPEYIRVQEQETRRAYYEVRSGANPDLVAFKNAIHIYVDTTELTTDETFELVLKRLKENNVI